jgi:hypothetical protein
LAYGLSLWRWRRIQVSSSWEKREKKGKRERTYLDSQLIAQYYFSLQIVNPPKILSHEPVCEVAESGSR